MKLKVNDICRVKPGEEARCINFKDFKGKFIKITGIDDIDNTLSYDIFNKNKVKVGNCSTCFHEDNLILVSKKNRLPKSKPVQFVAIYDEEDGDPHKLFFSRKEVIKWLKEVKDNSNIIFDSIVIYPLGKEMKPTLKIGLKNIK